MSAYDDTLSAYDDTLSAYDDTLSAYDDTLLFYDDTLSLYEDTLSLYEDTLSLYDYTLSLCMVILRGFSYFKFLHICIVPFNSQKEDHDFFLTKCYGITKALRICVY